MLSTVDDKDMAYALGASAYLPTPFDRERLVALLTKYRSHGSSNPVLIVEDDASTRLQADPIEKAWNAERLAAALNRLLPQQLRRKFEREMLFKELDHAAGVP